MPSVSSIAGSDSFPTASKPFLADFVYTLVTNLKNYGRCKYIESL
ncbi:hypothetical protein M125_3190 [Bacteroides fragilis str. 3998T(B)3]|uniref:Uncharacterized protein n=1 Tax=Bacteroides fragilis str. 3998T(B)3 TaxID=1339316 RepID=A0A015U5R0_BACFG|nr:hypothetical protein M125_3190 [Bacteroides fragilis str. 3998T(B)3]EXY95128.1 hypothetical protein M081_2840 [Bacteroides fragilis str. 3998 T(B) 4]EYB14727.1 hypothetical protein M140_2521 [Bacteroides fragilis str. S38L3]